MALSSSSTIQDAVNQYLDNSRYWESGDTAKNALEALMHISLRMDQVVSIAGTTYQRRNIDKMIEDVRSHVMGADTRSGSRFVSGRRGVR